MRSFRDLVLSLKIYLLLYISRCVYMCIHVYIGRFSKQNSYWRFAFTSLRRIIHTRYMHLYTEIYVYIDACIKVMDVDWAAKTQVILSHLRM